MGIYLWTSWTTTSYDIADIISDPYSLQYPSDNLWKMIVDYENDPATWEAIEVLGDAWNCGVNFWTFWMHFLDIRLHNTSISLDLGWQYSYSTVESSSWIITANFDTDTYTVDVTAIVDWWIPVPFYSTWSLWGEKVWTPRTATVNIYQWGLSWSLDLITWSWEQEMKSAYIWWPVIETFTVDLTNLYSNVTAFQQWDPVKKLWYVFDIQNNVQFYWALYVGGNSLSFSWNSLWCPGWIWLLIWTNNLQWTIMYDFNTGIATWSLTDWGGNTEAWSRQHYASIDWTQDIWVSWSPPSWWDTPTGYVEIRIER